MKIRRKKNRWTARAFRWAAAVAVALALLGATAGSALAAPPAQNGGNVSFILGVGSDGGGSNLAVIEGGVTVATIAGPLEEVATVQGPEEVVATQVTGFLIFEVGVGGSWQGTGPAAFDFISVIGGRGIDGLPDGAPVGGAEPPPFAQGYDSLAALRLLSISDEGRDAFTAAAADGDIGNALRVGLLAAAANLFGPNGPADGQGLLDIFGNGEVDDLTDGLLDPAGLFSVDPGNFFVGGDSPPPPEPGLDGLTPNGGADGFQCFGLCGAPPGAVDGFPDVASQYGGLVDPEGLAGAIQDFFPEGVIPPDLFNPDIINPDQFTPPPDDNITSEPPATTPSSPPPGGTSPPPGSPPPPGYSPQRLLKSNWLPV